MVDYETGTQFDVMFTRMGFDGALRLCNVLNGGPGKDFADPTTVKTWGMCAHG